MEELAERLTLSGLNHDGTADAAGDITLDLEVTSNRPDCLGHVGIAREVAALYGTALQLPPTEFAEGERRTAELIAVEIAADARAWCPQYRARVIEGVAVGPSPAWMQRRLRAVGVTPVNNVVDVTNYVMLEVGQPLHAFDYDKLRGRRIVVRHAHKGERLEAINHRTYELEPWMGVIADAETPAALAGVMGGASTEIGAHTTSILLEAAEFAPLAVRRTSRTLDLLSDSSYRFERKVDPAGLAFASDRACHLLAELAGGRVAAGAVHVGAPSWQPQPIRLRLAQVARVLGVDVPGGRVEELLRHIGLVIQERGDGGLTVLPPSFRRDLQREIDLVEEVGRRHG